MISARVTHRQPTGPGLIAIRDEIPRSNQSTTMDLPNGNLAIIEPVKLQSYLLDIDHPYGGSKAKLLASLGYTAGNWQQLASDIRSAHLQEAVIESRTTLWGDRYEIVAPITGPSGDTVHFRSVWQIDLGTEAPRLITMYPE